jgi:cytochrome c biogenesis protein CcmG/thiol:disulfide interchange protein DsbE
MKRLITIILLFLSIQLYAQPKTNWDSLQTSHVGKPYLQFEATTLDGKKINNESLKGKITWLNFWFEACPGCRNEFDKLNRLYDSLKNDPDFQFVAITYDKKETLPAFIKQFGLNYPIATVANQDIAYNMNYRNGFPTNILIDKEGNIVFVRFWLMDREAKYGVTMEQAYKYIGELKGK